MLLAARLFGMAWNLATMFVIPVIALEDLPVSASIRRSASIFKSKWGESVVAQGTVGLAVMFAAIPRCSWSLLLAAVSVPLGIVLAVVLFGD